MLESIIVPKGLKAMFNSTEQEILDRIHQTKEILTLICNLSDQDNFSDSDILKIQKGYLFVSMYSSLEFSLVATVGRFLELLKHQPKKPLDYKRYILCSVLNANFNSIRDCSKKKVWDRKSDFLDALFSSDLASIQESVFPTDGINISHKQIQDIWKFFHLSGQPLPEGVTHLLLSEIKEHRNSIAHGREKAIEIGSRYTSSVLKGKSEAIERVCFHILEEFRSSYDSKGFLRETTA